MMGERTDLKNCRVSISRPERSLLGSSLGRKDGPSPMGPKHTLRITCKIICRNKRGARGFNRCCKASVNRTRRSRRRNVEHALE